MTFTAKNINFSKGLFRLWIVFCGFWSLFIALVIYQTVSGVSVQVLPWMEMHCTDLYPNDLSKEHIGCVETAAVGLAGDRLREDLGWVLFSAFLIPAILFAFGYAFLKGFQMNIPSKFFKSLRLVFKKVLWPFNWVIKGFSNKD